MFKDYYKILGIFRYASSQEIKSAYRTMSMKWHPDKNPGANVTTIMQDINEAYAILKDESKRERYNKEYDMFFVHLSTDSFKQSTNDSSKEYEYDYNVQDDTLKNDIADARQYAKKLVDEFLKSFKEASHNAAIGAWNGAKGYIYAGIFLTIIGGFVGTCMRNTQYNKKYTDTYTSDYSNTSTSITDIAQKTKSQQPVKSYSTFNVPKSWTKYSISGNSFSISVPSTVELRNEYDAYTKRIKNIGRVCDSDIVVFQQKGLASNSSEAYQHYCRIMIRHAVGKADDFLHSNETEPIDYDTKSFLRDLVVAELGGFSLLGEPSFKWIEIDDTKAIEIKYRRSGNDSNTTCCTMYLLFNYNEMVKMLVSYREQEKELWLPDLDNVIKTFKWEQ